MEILQRITAITIISTCLFVACSDDLSNRYHYKNLVNRSDSISIHFIDSNETVNYSGNEIDKARNMFARDIKTGEQSSFDPDTRVEFFEGGKRIAYLTIRIVDPKLNGNFYSDGAQFGILSTYGIWFGLEELKYYHLIQ